MTNVEKAREISDEYFWQDNAESYAPNAILEMAEWKDQQFKEYLEFKKLECTLLSKTVMAYDMSGVYDLEIRTNCFKDIINELFPEPKEQDNSENDD